MNIMAHDGPNASLAHGFVRDRPVSTRLHGPLPMQRLGRFTMPTSCSDASVSWEWAQSSALNQANGRCVKLAPGNRKAVPAPFEHHSHVCVHEDRGHRVIHTNSGPPHSVIAFTTHASRPTVCEACIKVTLPLHPQLLPHTTELPHYGPIGYSRHGIPLVASEWPVWNGFIFRSQSWRGHSGSHGSGWTWHYHHSALRSNASSIGSYAEPDELIGWAMDGFPIYGPLAASDEGALDMCNGRRTERGGYRYHVRRVESVDLSVPYCRKHGSRWVAGWSIILGCFHGDVSTTTIGTRSCLGWDDNSRCEVT